MQLQGPLMGPLWQGRIHDPGDAMLKSVKSLKIEIDKYCTDLQNTKLKRVS